MSNRQTHLGASIRDRLLNIARSKQEDFQSILTRYALERLLYRLSRSQDRDRFVLKGAMLFVLWSQEPHRATRDLDLLCQGDNTVAHLEQVFREICTTQVDADGLEFQSTTVRGIPIKEDQNYQGVRVTLNANLTGLKIRIPIQVDIGFGDSVYPGVEEIEFPAILENFPTPMLKAYQRETAIAEKFQAMVALGIANSRMKDFYDLWYLSQHFAFNGRVLSLSIEATFARRKTAVPANTPLALSSEFFDDESKQKQWKAFLRKGKLKLEDKGLQEVILTLQSFLLPPTQAIANEQVFDLIWLPSGSWQLSTEQ